jgi:hypothetical protein
VPLELHAPLALPPFCGGALSFFSFSKVDAEPAVMEDAKLHKAHGLVNPFFSSYLMKILAMTVRGQEIMSSGQRLAEVTLSPAAVNRSGSRGGRAIA